MLTRDEVAHHQPFLVELMSATRYRRKVIIATATREEVLFLFRLMSEVLLHNTIPTQPDTLTRLKATKKASVLRLMFRSTKSVAKWASVSEEDHLRKQLAAIAPTVPIFIDLLLKRRDGSSSDKK